MQANHTVLQVMEPPASLMEHLEGVLRHAEAEVREIVAKGNDPSRPTCFKPMRACINMVYGNATALCAAFGLPSTPQYAENLDNVTTRILELYSPNEVSKRTKGSAERAALRIAMEGWSKDIREDMKKAYIKIVEDIQVHVKQLAFSERAMLLLVRLGFF
jgi:hypothetical protein